MALKMTLKMTSKLTLKMTLKWVQNAVLNWSERGRGCFWGKIGVSLINPYQMAKKGCFSRGIRRILSLSFSVKVASVWENKGKWSKKGNFTKIV